MSASQKPDARTARAAEARPTPNVAGGEWEHDLFVAAPMAALQGFDRFQRSRTLILSLVGGIVAGSGIRRVYYAGQTIGEDAAFTRSEDALEQDLGALARSKALLLIYPEKVATGALVELGYAMALRRPAVILVRRHDDLPYFMKHLRGASRPGVSGPLAVFEYQQESDLLPNSLAALEALGAAGC